MIQNYGTKIRERLRWKVSRWVPHGSEAAFPRCIYQFLRRTLKRTHGTSDGFLGRGGQEPESRAHQERKGWPQKNSHFGLGSQKKEPLEEGWTLQGDCLCSDCSSAWNHLNQWNWTEVSSHSYLPQLPRRTTLSPQSLEKDNILGLKLTQKILF